MASCALPRDIKETNAARALARSVALDVLREWCAHPRELRVVSHGSCGGQCSFVERVGLPPGPGVVGVDVEKVMKRALRQSGLDSDGRRFACAAAYGIVASWQRWLHMLALRGGVPSSGGDEAELLLQLWEELELNVIGVDDFHGTASQLGRGDGGEVASTIRGASVCDPDAVAALALEASLPYWFACTLIEDWGLERAWRVGAGCVGRARTTLRANALKTDASTLLQKLEDVGLPVVLTEGTPWGITFSEDLRVHVPQGAWGLPGYSDGLFEVQDGGSQQIVLATAVRAGGSVLDYCCGTGGKSLALAAMVGSTGRVVAWDIDGSKRRHVGGARRDIAGAAAVIHVADQAPGRSDFFDVVLVDAPCSSSGVLRRHPSQRWTLLSASTWAQTQLEILQEAAAHVVLGGTLVYGTCSVLRGENVGVVEAFERALGREFQPWALDPCDNTTFQDAVSGGHWRQLFPSAWHDGVFFARWRRVAPSAMVPDTEVGTGVLICEAACNVALTGGAS